jgi:hypothetical protein
MGSEAVAVTHFYVPLHKFPDFNFAWYVSATAGGVAPYVKPLPQSRLER